MTTPTLTDFLLARFTDLEYAIDLALKGDDGSASLRRILLADVEAKRRIVGRHDVVDVTGGCAFCGEPAPCEHLRALALPYADHPDYREEEWKP